jgi:membrane associated rhomboid family serine protease
MTLRIVILTVITSVICFYNREMLAKLIFNPWLVSERKQWYRMITSGFIHADWLHLGLNMLVFFSFGLSVERYYALIFGAGGTYYFVLLYMAAILFSITPSYVKHKHDYHYNALGASGAVAAVLFTAILFNPLAPVYLFGIIKLPGILVGIGYLFYEYRAGKRGETYINHDAHFWGALFGVAYTILIHPPVVIHFFDQLTHF